MALPRRCFLKRFRRFFLSYACIAIGIGLLTGLALVQMTDGIFGGKWSDSGARNGAVNKATTLETPVQIGPLRTRTFGKSNRTDPKVKWLNERIERMNREVRKIQMRREVVTRQIVPSDRFHIFYYAWYENIEHDGAWRHWNHKYIKNWHKPDGKVYPTGSHSPPDDIGSNFYPRLGCYSSRSLAIVDVHMRQIKNTGVGVLIVSWYPPGLSDEAGHSPDPVFFDLLNAASRHGLKIAPHIEPYTGRNPVNFLTHLKYFTGTYGDHPALYRMRRDGVDLIVYYLYDSYRTPANSWWELFSQRGNISVRGTKLDGIFLGLLVDTHHRHEIRRAHFDGFYTYFASNGFSYGSTWKNWKALGTYARQNGLLFSPSVGPGYVDTRVRPWNAGSTRHRRRGKYYDVGWRTAIAAGADLFSITSFNEWHEGTQIEPAVAKATGNYTYMDYEPEGPDFYLNLTNWWISEVINKTVPS